MSSQSMEAADYSATPEPVPAWKQEINARLVAHRTRRPKSTDQPALPGLETDREASRAARVAARVAERYSKAPTYSEMLAIEAANAARAAEAAAQAAHEAHAAAQAILAGLDFEREQEAEPQPEPQAVRYEPKPEPVRVQYHVHPDSLPQPRSASVTSENREAAPARSRVVEAYPLDVEDPLSESLIAGAQPLPTKLIEFPRELIATRKARPRHAEGPLRESEEPEKAQLRIFEVEPEDISHEAVTQTAEDSVKQRLPEWHSIQLDAQPHYEAAERPLGRRTVDKQQNARQSEQARSPLSYSPLSEMLPLHVAPMEDRLMAAIVDVALVMVAFLLFLLVFVACTTHPPTGKPALMAAGALLVGFFALYQWLFFTYAEATPGMRYAKIALCTFEDENPTRQAMRGRIAGLLLSALPLGLGFLWALFDDDRLGWHDRMTRTYQRSYRG
jgi:uncharacterized RDD family membrane protein YckC/proteasome lid subunit RPN8/RPN11